MDDARVNEDVEEKRFERDTFGRPYDRLVIEDKGDRPSGLRIRGRMREDSVSDCCGDEDRWSSDVDVMRAYVVPFWAVMCVVRS